MLCVASAWICLCDVKENYLAYHVMTSKMTEWCKEATEMLMMHRVMRCLLLYLLPSWDTIASEWHCIREKLTLINSSLSRGYVSFSQITHLCTLTCCAAHPRPGNNRCDCHRASRARAVAEHLSTRWLDSQNSRPRGLGRILLVWIHGRVCHVIRPEKL